MAMSTRPLRLMTVESIGDADVVTGDIVFAAAVSGANIIRDMREAITNTIGGRMTRYEALVDATVARALETLGARAREQGYDGVLGVRLSHPAITDGAVEVVATGTGFRYRR
jgi:uncharacterized protein YbjQ (UPF0145 family)